MRDEWDGAHSRGRLLGSAAALKRHSPSTPILFGTDQESGKPKHIYGCDFPSRFHGPNVCGRLFLGPSKVWGRTLSEGATQ